MKKILTAILLICVAVTSGYAQTDSVAPVKEEAATQAQPQPQAQPKETTAATVSGNELVQRGDSAYTADNFALAEQLYTAAMKESGTSSTLFYNLGNAYYRQGNLGKAIVNYERALKLDPTNDDARANLEFVKTKITDRQIDSGSIMEKLRDGIVEYFHADTWAWITVVLFALCPLPGQRKDIILIERHKIYLLAEGMRHFLLHRAVQQSFSEFPRQGMHGINAVISDVYRDGSRCKSYRIRQHSPCIRRIIICPEECYGRIHL